jgi:hypothetical protein
MLLWILDRLATFWPKADWAARLAGWTKITFRAALAALLSFVLAVLLGPWVIAWLQTRFREPLSNRSPKLRELSQHKAATPTMGGLFLVAGIVAAAAVLCNWQNGYIPIVLLNLVGMATIGAVSNPDNMNISIGKAGRKRWMGRMPHNRGVSMNPIDHPHGGGEGRTSGGRHPVTPWGFPTKGKKTRKNKSTTKFIIASRHARKKK